MERAIRVGKRFFDEFNRNDLPELAAGLAYRFLFAIFPFGLFVAALTAFAAQWIGLNDPSAQIMAALGDNLPSDIAEAIRPELQRVLDVARPELVSIGALGALWAATGGSMSLIKGTNRAFEVEDSRGFFHKTGLAIGLTLLATIGVLASFVTIVGGSFITEQIAQQLGLGAAWPTISLLRWPLVAVALSLAVGLLYRAAPDCQIPWRWAVAGGAIFTVGWLLVTAVFAWYVTNLGDFGATYGALGGVIVVMLWFYLTGLLLLVSAQLIAVLLAEFQPETRETPATDATASTDQAAATGAPAPVTAVEPPPARRARTREAAERGSAMFAGAVAAIGLAIGALLARLAGSAKDDT